jgi:glutathione peroxidase
MTVNDLNVHDIETRHLDGRPLRLAEFRGDALLIVNVASKCGLTPQYAGLQELDKAYRDRGFSVVGVPCNQFGGQEPGTPEEIREFCSTSYDVTFPITERVDVNGPNRHPLYDVLTEVPDSQGAGGYVEWNFEKFLVGADGVVVRRFRPGVVPEDQDLRDAIEQVLPRWRSVAAETVQPGDTVRSPKGEIVLVREIQEGFFGRPEMLALIGDRNGSWYKRPLARDVLVEVLEG